MTDVAGYLRKMADDERKLDHARRLSDMVNALPSRGQVAEGLMNNALSFVNAYQVPRDLGVNLAQALAAIPGDAYRGMKAHMTGQIPLTGERDREGAIHSLNALSGAGLASPLAGRALQGVASTAKPARGIKAYHGTSAPEDFTEFKLFREGEIAPFFGPAHVASEYANIEPSRGKWKDDLFGRRDAMKPRVFPVIINGKKTLELVGDRHRHITADEFREGLERAGSPTGHISRDLSEKVQLRELRDWAKLEGFDVIERRHHTPVPGSPYVDEQPHIEYAPLKRGTVKSATTGKTLYSGNRAAALPFVDEEE